MGIILSENGKGKLPGKIQAGAVEGVRPGLTQSGIGDGYRLGHDARSPIRTGGRQGAELHGAAICGGLFNAHQRQGDLSGVVGLIAQGQPIGSQAHGAALPFGRSLGYRIGQSAFYAACIWAGLEPLPLPVMKGIIVRNLAWWLARPIFDRDGVLTIGYGYPQMYMAEQYNAPGSPYWGLKVFLLLALPDDHPFWACEAAPLPEELTRPGVIPQPSADLLLQRLPDGQLNAYSPANYEKGDHGQFTEKYGKFVYSTRFGFSASRSYVQLEQTAPDSMLAFVIDGWTFVRRHSDKFVLLGDRLLSEWRPFPGIKVTTELVPTAWGHTRTHTVESSIACTAYDCGFAVPKFAAGFAQSAAGSEAEAKNAACRCVVKGAAGQGVVINAAPNTNLYDPNTVIPAVRYEIPVGTAVLNTRVESRHN